MSSIVVAGDTSGSVTLQAPTVAGTTVLTLPAVSGTVLATGSIVTEAQGGTGTTTGYYGFKNRIINGSFQIWQRSTSAAGTAGYLTADRFSLTGGGTVTNSQSATPNSPNGNYSYVWTTGAASSYVNVSQAIERVNVYALRGKTVSVNYWVMSTGTAYVGIQNVQLFYSNTTDAINSSVGPLSAITATNISPTSSWQQVKATFLIPTDAVGLTVMMNTSVVEPSGVVVSLADLQLELGSTATSFDYRPYGTELQLCQRYYQNNLVAFGTFYSTTGTQFQGQFTTTMRVSPTIGLSTGTSLAINISGVGAATINTPTFAGINNPLIGWSVFGTISTGTSVIGTPTQITSTVIQASAEL
jgi:hypothetical protein